MWLSIAVPIPCSQDKLLQWPPEEAGDEHPRERAEHKQEDGKEAPPRIDFCRTALLMGIECYGTGGGCYCEEEVRGLGDHNADGVEQARHEVHRFGQKTSISLHPKVINDHLHCLFICLF